MLFLNFKARLLVSYRSFGRGTYTDFLPFSRGCEAWAFLYLRV